MLLGGALVGLRGVLLPVYLPARVVLLAVDLPAFLRSESAAVGCALVAHFAVDVAFAVFEAGGLTGRESAGGGAVGDAGLLVPGAAVDGIKRSRRRTAMIDGRERIAVTREGLFMRDLAGRGLEVLFAREALLLRGGGGSRCRRVR